VASSFRVIESPDQKTWDNFVTARNGHLLQTTVWGELKSRFGWSAQRLAVEQDGAMVAGAQILHRGLPFGLILAYVPRGPVCDPNDLDTLAALFDAVCAAARERGAFAVKIEPNWEAQALTLAFSSRGRGNQVGSCIQPHTTIHVDLTRDLDAILADMKPKWRYNIRLAERKGVIVREGNVSDLPMFYELLQVTSKRDAFPIHTLGYYRAVYKLLTACNYARLFIAEYSGEPIAAIFVTAFAGEAIYLYGASGNAHRDKMPNHALHWDAIKWAKALGCMHYDLWGVGAAAEAELGELHVGSGLYQFKQGFGGRVVNSAGAHNVIFSRWRFARMARASAERGAMG
jgi:lipid II:glycine glycyltransferase (peptidoglycan interpeptide bridge formation enzyme)